MHNPNKRLVVNKVRTAPYAPLFRSVFGPDALVNVNDAYDAIAHAIAEYERTPEVSPFSSKYDAFAAGQALLSADEARGLALFESKGRCFNCHPTTSTPRRGMSAGPVSLGERIGAMFTIFRYVNIGLPRNPDNPFYTLPPALNELGAEYVDLGLGATLDDPAQNGKFRIPTLRNVIVTPPHSHNGYFSTPHDMVQFINSRDVAAYPAPEVPETVHMAGGMGTGMGMMGMFGNFGLSPDEIDAIVAFLGTLTDGYMPME
jgi:cytochrome c peroxidase